MLSINSWLKQAVGIDRTIVVWAFLLPCVWLATAFYLRIDGAKVLAPIMLLSVLIVIGATRWEYFVINWQRNHWLKWITASMLFGMAMETWQGYGSREIRALQLIFLLHFFPLWQVKARFWILLLAVATISFYGYALYNPPLKAWVEGGSNPIAIGTYASLLMILWGWLLVKPSALWMRVVCIVGLVMASYVLLKANTRGAMLALLVVMAYIVWQSLKSYGKLRWLIPMTALVSMLAIKSFTPWLDWSWHVTKHRELTPQLRDITQESYLQQDDKILVLYDRVMLDLDGLVKMFSDPNFDYSKVDRSMQTRLAQWKIGLEQWPKHPFLGNGKEGVQEYVDQLYQDKLISWDLHNAFNYNLHNVYVDRLVDTGLIGLGMLLGMFFYLLKISEQSTAPMLLRILVLHYALLAVTDMPNSVDLSYFMLLFLPTVLVNGNRLISPSLAEPQSKE